MFVRSNRPVECGAAKSESYQPEQGIDSDQNGAGRSGETHLRVGMGGERRSTQHYEKADEATHQRYDGGCCERILHVWQSEHRGIDHAIHAAAAFVQRRLAGCQARANR